MQRERMIRPRNPETDRTSLRLADALFLLVAIFRLRRSCNLVRRALSDEPVRCLEVDEAAAAFDQAVPQLDTFRHATEHFDEWIFGEGRRQPPAADGTYPFRTKATHVRVHTNDARGDRYLFELEGIEIDLCDAADAASHLGIRLNGILNRDADDLPQRYVRMQQRRT